MLGMFMFVLFIGSQNGRGQGQWGSQNSADSVISQSQTMIGDVNIQNPDSYNYKLVVHPRVVHGSRTTGSSGSRHDMSSARTKERFGSYHI